MYACVSDGRSAYVLRLIPRAAHVLRKVSALWQAQTNEVPQARGVGARGIACNGCAVVGLALPVEQDCHIIEAHLGRVAIALLSLVSFGHGSVHQR